MVGVTAVVQVQSLAWELLPAVGVVKKKKSIVGGKRLGIRDIIQM